MFLIKSIFIEALCTGIFVTNAFGQDGAYLKPPMDVSEMTIGLDYRNDHAVVMDSAERVNTPFTSTAVGIQGGYQTSFTLDHFAPQRGKRLRFGDLFGARASFGYYHATLKSVAHFDNLWAAYQFNIGATAIYRISRTQDLGLHLIMLTFAHDRVSPNVSGSALILRYRVNGVQLEAGIEGLRNRIFGFTNALTGSTTAPYDYLFTDTYVLNAAEKVGFRIHYFSNSKSTYVDPATSINPHSQFALNIFYGLSLDQPRGRFAHRRIAVRKLPIDTAPVVIPDVGPRGMRLVEVGFNTGYGYGINRLNLPEGSYRPLLFIARVAFGFNALSTKYPSGGPSLIAEPQFNTVLIGKNGHATQAYEVGIGFGIQEKFLLLPNLSGNIFFVVGPHLITANTVRQHKGFIFSDNLGMGLAYAITRKWSLSGEFRTRHLSNGDVQKPNLGINTFNYLVGFARLF